MDIPTELKMPLPKAEKECPGCGETNPNAIKMCKFCHAELITPKRVKKEDFRCSSTLTDVKNHLEKRAHQLWANHNYHVVVLYFSDKSRKRCSSFATPGHAERFRKRVDGTFLLAYKQFIKISSSTSTTMPQTYAMTDEGSSTSTTTPPIHVVIDEGPSTSTAMPPTRVVTDEGPSTSTAMPPTRVVTDEGHSTSTPTAPNHVVSDEVPSTSAAMPPTHLVTDEGPSTSADTPPTHAVTDEDPVVSTATSPSHVMTDDENGRSKTKGNYHQFKRKKSRSSGTNKKQKERDWQCIFCDGSWSESVPGEKWVQCQSCNDWAHIACTVGLNLNSYVCDLCL